MKLQPIPCKVGTQSWVVYRDRRQPIEVGRRIRIRDATHGSKWIAVIVDQVEPFKVRL